MRLKKCFFFGEISFIRTVKPSSSLRKSRLALSCMYFCHKYGCVD